MGGEYAAHVVGLLLVYLFFFFVREQHYLGRLCVCSPFFRPILCSEGFCVGCSLVDLSLYARSETFSRGFFPLPIGQKEEWDANSNRTHNALLRSSEEHEKRTLSVLQTKAFRNTKARQSPKRKRRGRPKAKSYYYGVLSKGQSDTKKRPFIYNMFRVCKRGSLLLLFFCASVRLSLLRTPFFSSPPLFRPRRVEASSP